MSPTNLWSRILIVTGSIAMLIGAVDFIEGSILILPGSGLLALGTYAGHCPRRWIHYRLWAFILIFIGVGAMWGLATFSGVGDKVRYSPWWGLWMLPYLAGWTMSIWGPGSPRWFLALGILAGIFHLWLMSNILLGDYKFIDVAIALGVLGLVTIGGCAFRWKTISSPKCAGGWA